MTVLNKPHAYVTEDDTIKVSTLKSTHVIIAKKDLPSGLKTTVMTLRNGLGDNDAFIVAALVAEQLEEK